MGGKHSRQRDGRRLVWRAETLWTAVRDQDLKAFRLPIREIEELDRDCWFGEDHPTGPTIRAVVGHCRRIEEADLSHPVILNVDGTLMDGGHRIGRAMLEGRDWVAAVRLEREPEPDAVLE